MTSFQKLLRSLSLFVLLEVLLVAPDEVYGLAGFLLLLGTGYLTVGLLECVWDGEKAEASAFHIVMPVMVSLFLFFR